MVSQLSFGFFCLTGGWSGKLPSTARDEQRKMQLAPLRWINGFQISLAAVFSPGVIPGFFSCVQVTMFFLCLHLLVVDKYTGSLLEEKIRSKQSSR